MEKKLQKFILNIFKKIIKINKVNKHLLIKSEM